MGEGREVYHLGFGESRFPVHPKIREALRANVHQKSYLAGQGLAELRGQIADFYSQRLDWMSAAQVMVGPGSKAILYAAQMALEAELILPTPCWVSYAPQAELLHKAVRHVPASPADGYALSLDALDATLRASTSANKILLITSPNNPTGQMYTPSFLAELAELFCRQRGVLVISDEIYALVPHGHRPHVSISHFYPEGAIVLSGLSKHLSLGGWRLGSAILPDHAEGPRLMTALRVIAGEIWSTTTGPVQYAGITAYGDDPEIAAYIDECAAIHAIRTQYLWRELSALGIPSARPDGGFYMFPNFDRWRASLAERGVQTSTDLANHLLDDYQLATLPGTAFATPAHDLSLRLASSYLDMEDDARAEAILAAYRDDPEPERFMADHHPATNEAVARFGEFVDALG